jgi:hypothetical protein
MNENKINQTGSIGLNPKGWSESPCVDKSTEPLPDVVKLHGLRSYVEGEYKGFKLKWTGWEPADNKTPRMGGGIFIGRWEAESDTLDVKVFVCASPVIGIDGLGASDSHRCAHRKIKIYIDLVVDGGWTREQILNSDVSELLAMKVGVGRPIESVDLPEIGGGVNPRTYNPSEANLAKAAAEVLDRMQRTSKKR